MCFDSCRACQRAVVVINDYPHTQCVSTYLLLQEWQHEEGAGVQHPVHYSAATDAIGHGAFGVVYKGTLTPNMPGKHPIPVAIKVITDGISLQNRRALFQDLSTVFYARSPYIVAFHGLHFANGAAHISMGETDRADVTVTQHSGQS